MPIIKHIVTEDYSYCIWEITESPEELKSLLLSKSQVQVFDKERRNRHFLSSRLLFETLLGSSDFCILKDEFGKPYLENSKQYISLSHSGEYAVGILSNSACGIDIEQFRDKILAIGPRFCSDKEMAAIEAGTEKISFYLIWSIKESLFKLYGRKSVNFKQHLEVGNFDIQQSNGTVKAWIKKNGISKEYSVHYQLFDEYVLSWVAS